MVMLRAAALFALLALAPFAAAQTCDPSSAPRGLVKSVSGGATCDSDPVIGCLSDFVLKLTASCGYAVDTENSVMSAESILLPTSYLNADFKAATGNAPWTKGTGFYESCATRIGNMSATEFNANGAGAGLASLFNFVGSYNQKTEYSVTAGANGFTVTKGSCSYTYVLVQDKLGAIDPDNSVESGDCAAGSFKASADVSRICVLCPPGSWSAAGATSCKPATAGRFIDSVGATADGQICPAGTYGSPSHKPFMSPVDKVYFGNCLPCKVDTYTPFPGMSECFTCKQGGAPVEGSPRCIAGYGGMVLTVEGADMVNASLIYDPNDQIWNTNYTLPAGYGILLGADGKPADNPAVVTYGDPVEGWATALMPASAPTCASTNPWLGDCVYTATGASKNLAIFVAANGEATISVLHGAACGTLDADGTANSINNQTGYYVDPNTVLIPGEDFVALVTASGSGTSSYTVFPLSNDASSPVGAKCSVGTVTQITNSFGGSRIPVHADCPGGTTYDEKMDANDNAARYCRVCRLGTFCPKTAGVSPIERDCNSGTYATLFGQDTMPQCVACGDGTYTDKPGMAGNNSCESCAIGITLGKDYCSNTCPDGQEAVNGQCQDCAAGNFRNGDMLQCIGCDAGSETASVAGVVSAAPGSATCQPCDAGFANGNHTGEDYKLCQPCNNGTYAPRGGMDACALCPLGTFSLASGSIKQCTSCNKGYYTPKRGSTSCTACGAGTYSNTMAAKSAAYCLRCTPGTFNNASASTSCKCCAKGYYAPAFGSRQCLPCPPGFFQDLTCMGFCKPAPKGYFSLGASVAPTQCDIGTFQDQKGQSGCKPCPPGGYCISKGLTIQAFCPVGTFNPLRGSSSITDCKACPRGKTTARTGASASAQCTVNSG